MEDKFPTRDVYTVTRLNQAIRALIEASFPMVWVEGEISNLARPRSGHVYFSLKDEECQVRCALFRAYARHVGFALEDGARVLARARAGIYLQRGDFQLVVEYLEEAGEGALRRAFEVLKRQLAARGLFDAACKKSPPVVPRRIGVVTSPGGAAIRDILAVLKRRFPSVPVLVYPAAVQGGEAVPEITRMLDLASRRRECDVLILARGGGSLEDFHAFNEEAVAEAIYRCEIPIVSAIGHEIDFTIADFVADRRAPTPSAAAELVVPDQREWRQKAAVLAHRIASLARGRLAEIRRGVFWLGERLARAHPERRLSDNMQRVDDLTRHLAQHMRAFSSPRRNHAMQLMARLYRHEPSPMIRTRAARREQLARRLIFAVKRNLDVHAGHVASLRRALDAMSPRRTLERGYAVVTKPPGNEVVRDARSMREGDRVHARLARGTLLCAVLPVEGEKRGAL